MSVTNDFLAFCPTDTGTNLLSESDYLASADRTSGNKPGIASAKLNNRAIRQANAVTSQLAQLMANVTNTNATDDNTPTKLLAQLTAALIPLPKIFTSLLSGSGTFNLSYVFFVASANATAAATYSDGTTTFTVSTTISGGLQLVCTGAAAPISSGTLTKTGGTGDATITFYATRVPVLLEADLVGGGGGGGGSGTTAGTAATNGGNTTFGSQLSAGGGVGGSNNGQGGTGGTGTLGTVPDGFAVPGGGGGPSATANGTNPQGFACGGGVGGSSARGGGGPGGTYASVGNNGATNTGGGGSGAGNNLVIGGACGSGGGSGAFVKGFIKNPTGQFAWAVGGAGTHGIAGTSGSNGGDGGSGSIFVVLSF